MRLWKEFIDQQEKVYGKATIDGWLRSLNVVTFDARNLYLEAAHSFQVNWFEEHIRPKLKFFQGSSGKPIAVHIKLNEKKSSPFLQKFQNPQAFKPDPLNFDATFDLFYVTSSNALAYMLFEKLKRGETSFNPIFLSGPVGSGKTHLLMSAARFFEEKGRIPFYVSAKTFTSHVVGAIQSGNMTLFRKAYRNIDALLVDNVHELERKAATQEEFFHTFNALHTEGKQIILSASYAPQELKYIEQRLISRFEWGISLALDPPSSEDLHAILIKKAEQLKFSLSCPVISYLIETFNPSSLFVAFDALILRMREAKNVHDVQIALKDLIEKEGRKTLTTDAIIRTVAAFYDVETKDILGKSQTRESAHPRKMAMYLLRHLLNLSFVKIGEIFCRDHSTVMSGIRSITSNSMDDAHSLLKKLKGG